MNYMINKKEEKGIALITIALILIGLVLLIGIIVGVLINSNKNKDNENQTKNLYEQTAKNNNNIVLRNNTVSEINTNTNTNTNNFTVESNKEQKEIVIDDENFTIYYVSNSYFNVSITNKTDKNFLIMFDRTSLNIGMTPITTFNKIKAHSEDEKLLISFSYKIIFIFL